MKYWFQPGMLALAAILAVAACLPFASTTSSRRDFYFFEAELTSNRDGETQVFFDTGKGDNESDSSRQPLHATAKPVNYRFMLPIAVVSGLRFDPIDREGVMTISHARIVDHRGHVLRNFRPEDLQPIQQIAQCQITGEVAHIETEKNASDPITKFAFGPPLSLEVGLRDQIVALAPVFAIVFVCVLALMAAFGLPAVQSLFARLVARARVHPIAALAMIAGIAVALQCHPVLFFGKSLVSPDNAGYLLYDRYPTLPGYQTDELEEAHGSDVGAILYQHLYYPILEREAVLKYGELPFWNRYDLCGVPLLGQGQSMFGDALNLIPMAGNGAALSWDVKFVLARWLYAFGIALGVLRLTRHLASAAVLAFTAAFIGFFAFRLNHPAQFGLCYSPWILVAWLWVRDAHSWKSLGAGMALWVFANWEAMTSGTVKEAYMLILCVNFAGLLILLFSAARWRTRLVQLGAMGLAGVVFLLLTAPLWMTFLDTLKVSHSSYEQPAAAQIAPSLFIGFFEDLFYRQLRPNENHGNPSANFVVLLGVLWAIVRMRETFRDRGFVALGLAALLPLAIAFRIIPAALIVKVPLIANIQHTDNTFSCSAIVLLTVLSGFGLRALRKTLGDLSLLSRRRERERVQEQEKPLAHARGYETGVRNWLGWSIDVAVFAVLLSALLAIYFVSTAVAPKSAFFLGYTGTLVLALAAGLGGLAYGVRTGRSHVMMGTVVASLALLLWRHAEYVHSPFDSYVLNPKVRVDFRAKSAAVEQVRSLLTEPSRPVGLGYNLFLGFHQMLHWEGVYGVDALRNGYFDDLAIAGGAKKIRLWDLGNWNENDVPQTQAIQDLFNVRYYLASHRETPRVIPGLKWLGSHDLDVYESESVWPRAFFTDRLSTYGELIDFVEQVQTERKPFAAVQSNDRKNVEVRLPLRQSGRTIRPAFNYEFTANRTEFTVDATGPGVIVLTEGFYPKDFQVTINGEPATYFRVNHAFKGVSVPIGGRYRIAYTYRPHHLTRALVLWGVGLGLALVTATALVVAHRKSILVAALAT